MSRETPRDRRPLDPSTRAVHAGERQETPYDPVALPVFQTAPFRFPTAADLDRGFHHPDQRGLYSRYANPNVQAVEEKLAALEGAEAAVAFSSGMAAISGVLSTLLRSGDRLLVASDIYGGTSGWLDWLVERHPEIGVDRTPLDEVVDTVAAGPREGTRLVYLETPTNPLLRCCDLTRVGEVCADRDLPWMVDNTFATPILQRPLDHGATWVVHSATKYLGGHSDVIAGIVAGPADGCEAVRRTLRLVGGCLDPHAAYLLARGMKTLALRVERQSQTAARLARRLADHPAVARVYYPGDDPIAGRQMSAGGGMLSFEIEGGLEAANAFLDRLQLITIMPSLGGVETGAVLPAITSHKALSAAERSALGIADGLVRLSIGIEAADDLETDLVRALG